MRISFSGHQYFTTLLNEKRAKNPNLTNPIASLKNDKDLHISS